MRIKSRKIQGPMTEIVVIPRPDEDIVFTCVAVLDFEEFEKLVPEPTPPLKTDKRLITTKDFEDVDYKKAVDDRNFKRFKYIMVQSLRATEGLEWETVKYDQPDTWPLIDKELKDSGLSPSEVGLVYQGITTANAMNENRLEEGRKRFFDMAKQKVVS